MFYDKRYGDRNLRSWVIFSPLHSVSIYNPEGKCDGKHETAVFLSQSECPLLTVGAVVPCVQFSCLNISFSFLLFFKCGSKFKTIISGAESNK